MKMNILSARRKKMKMSILSMFTISLMFVSIDGWKANYWGHDAQYSAKLEI